MKNVTHLLKRFSIVALLTLFTLTGLNSTPPVTHAATTEITVVADYGSKDLSLGSKGANVTKLQEDLAELGFYSYSIDGSFSSKTRDAVVAFQKAQGLKTDGSVGSLTKAALNKALASTDLSSGSQGSAVTQLQEDLSELGFYPNKIDGSFGPKTHEAVVDFQKEQGLKTDGLVGPITQEALDKALAGTDLSSGSQGSAVTQLQKDLSELGFYLNKVDGSFGPKTRDAVVEFQNTQGLKTDAVVGPITQEALDKALAEGDLSSGSQGPAVIKLQEDLAQLGYYSNSIDGSFGAKTRTAVIAFQKAQGLKADGVVGSITRDKLNQALAGAPTKSKKITTVTVAAGTIYATPMYIIDSGKSGPTVMIVGGVHGNEPAGYNAAAKVKDWNIKKGKLIVLPQANKKAVSNKTRTYSGIDLNRQFPQSKTQSPKTTLAKAIWGEVKKYKVDWLMDMHEGYNYTKISDSVGQSIIYCPNSATQTMANAIVKDLNSGISTSYKKFTLYKYPVKGSLARAAGDYQGVNAFIFETASKPALSTRVNYQVKAAKTLLTRLGMY